MESKDADQAVLAHIQKLVAEEHGLFERGSLDERDGRRLKEVQVALDQCWDLLRQRRAMRETGHAASDAQVRPPEVVERYIG
jgi:hypothetical protein